ncbi:MAG: DUF4870 domain-containing protein [Cryobacterium sp.]|nr:DUF4870 domain-containing protein [Cryobacterium sp.]
MSTTPPPPPQNPYAASAPQPMNPGDEKTFSILTHILGIFFNFVPALIAYIVFRDRGPFIRQHTATALNFQITILIAYAVGVITTFLLIGFLILIATGILTIVFSIIAAVAANRGEYYTYPVAFKFVS